MKADRSIDCLGLYCPMPIIKTAEGIKEIAVGQILEVIADDKGIVEDMPTWCNMTGHEFLEIEENDDEYHVYIKRAL